MLCPLLSLPSQAADLLAAAPLRNAANITITLRDDPGNGVIHAFFREFGATADIFPVAFRVGQVRTAGLLAPSRTRGCRVLPPLCRRLLRPPPSARRCSSLAGTNTPNRPMPLPLLQSVAYLITPLTPGDLPEQLGV